MNVLWLTLHLLSVAAWVGGMLFAIVVLRPSLAVLSPGDRVALHGQAFRRFFLVVWHAMPITIISGLLLVWSAYGGFANANPAVHTMTLLGLIMAAVFVWIFVGPWRAMRGAIGAQDQAAAGVAAARIRQLVIANLVLGALTIILGAWARYGG